MVRFYLFLVASNIYTSVSVDVHTNAFICLDFILYIACLCYYRPVDKIYAMKRFTLNETADLAQDLFYRDYKKDFDYFDTPHFLMLTCTTYAKIMNDMYQEEKNRTKQSEGFSFVGFSGPWIVTEACEIQEKHGKKYIQTKMPLFSFDFDSLCSSIVSVTKSAGSPCGELIRISNKDVWKLCAMPKCSDIFYYQLGEDIFLANISCNPGKLIVNYIPALMPDNVNCTIPETMIDGIITTVLQIMFGAKNQTAFVKTANDGNINPDPQHETAQKNIQQ